MKNNLTTFNFGTNEVRTVTIDGGPWFVAKDICDVLEHIDTSMACSGLGSDEKGTSLIKTSDGDQNMVIISKVGVYRLILSSRKDSVNPVWFESKFQKLLDIIS